MHDEGRAIESGERLKQSEEWKRGSATSSIRTFRNPLTSRPHRNHAIDLSSSTEHATMKTNWYDVITSFLMACILMLASIVGVLFLVWMLTDQEDHFDKVAPWLPNSPVRRALRRRMPLSFPRILKLRNWSISRSMTA